MARLSGPLRFVRVLTAAQFQLDYGESGLGYAWALLKPLATFSVLYVVFGRVLPVGRGVPDFALFLLIGLVLWSLFAETTQAAVVSIVQRRILLRQIRFPAIVLPLAVIATASVTFALNVVVLVGFLAWKHVAPAVSWLLLPFLLVELLAFSLGVSLLLATLYVHLRDTVQAWALVLQIGFYFTPIVYALARLPRWGRDLELVNPVTQVIVDVRGIVLGSRLGPMTTDPGLFRLVPVAVAVAVLVAGLTVFGRAAPWFPERS